MNLGIFEKIFGKREPAAALKAKATFQLLEGYTPMFQTWAGSIFESDLIRAALDAHGRHAAKLQPNIQGSAQKSLQSKLRIQPNEFQTWGQFLYRLDTILDVHNTAFIVPVFDEYGDISGVFTPLPNQCEIVAYDKVPYLRYRFNGGMVASIELSLCGIMVTHQYRSDFFGESNDALYPTMELINIQNQGIEEGVKSAATYRFMAQLSNFAKPEDLALERQRFTEKNLSKDANGGGLLLFPNTYKDVKQIDVKPWVIDADQMKIINENVNCYFGVNDDVLTNKAYGDAWSAFYEGAIEPFAIQLSEVLSKMLFTMRERSQGNGVSITSNRLQYLSNKDKLDVSAQMADRGLMTRNEIRDIWNLPPLPEGIGDQLPIRGEYYNVGEQIGENEE